MHIAGAFKFIVDEQRKRASKRAAEQIAWLGAFGAVDNQFVKDGLRGAIVGAPADPEAFG